jgi:hypothetical protein
LNSLFTKEDEISSAESSIFHLTYFAILFR